MRVSIKPAKERVLYFDVLNIIACISVIFLHHNGIFDRYKPEIVSVWSQSLIVEVLAYFAVPVFFMLTGATLMEYRKRYDTRTFFQKRLSRVLVPFIVWSIITFLYALWQGRYLLDQLSFAAIWDIFMQSDMMAIYWFFPAIISIYLAIPVLSLLTQRKVYRKWLWYMVGVGLLTYSVLPLICKLLGLQFNTSYQMPLTGGGYVIYALLGYLLATQKLKTKWLVVISIGAVAALAFKYGLTYYLTLQNGATNTTLINYMYFTTMLPAVAVFILAQRIPWKKYLKGRLVNIIAVVSSCSLGIYLIHLVVMYLLLGLFHMNELQSLWRFVMPFVTYATCLTVVWIVKSGVISRRLFP